MPKKSKNPNVPELDRYSGSWVIVRKDTGEKVVEIFSRSVVEKINFEKYAAKTAYQYLTEINQKIKEESS